MKRFFIIFFVLLMLPSFTVNAETDAFNDISGHWAQSSINTAAKMGLISGLPDGSFSPDSPVTLGEMLAMLVPLVTGKKPKITDDDDWYAPYADEAFKCGILNSFTSDELAGFYNLPTIRVVNNVLFANTLVSLKLTPKHEITPMAVSKSRLGLSLYKDLNDIFNDVYIVSTYLCVAHNILKGTPQRTIEPYSYLTRAEAVTMLLRLKNYQILRANDVYYTDPLSYWDYYFTCIRTTGGNLFPIEDAGRPVVDDEGTVYIPVSGIVKILEACESDFVVHYSKDTDIYSGFYNSYISVPTDDYYSYIQKDDSLYGYSHSYNGYIEYKGNKRYEFECPSSDGSGMVVHNTPLLPIKDVLDFFDIHYKDVTVSYAKSSVLVEF